MHRWISIMLIDFTLPLSKDDDVSWYHTRWHDVIHVWQCFASSAHIGLYSSLFSQHFFLNDVACLSYLFIVFQICKAQKEAGSESQFTKYS